MRKLPSDTLETFVRLGEYLKDSPNGVGDVIRRAAAGNPWFTEDNSRRALQAVTYKYLDSDSLGKWLDAYPDLPSSGAPAKTVAVIAAGNLPLVGLHDVLSVLVSGHRLLLKVSGKDDVLLPWILDRLAALDEELAQRMEIAERLKDFDAVIATGNNNSARYFEYYFGRVPNIIRKNRNSVAVLTGDESPADLDGLSDDIFSYFGLGCRNVSKLYLPEDFDIDELKAPFEARQDVFDHNQYRNNLDYNRTLLLMNNIPFHDIDNINVTHNPSVASPIGNLHYEYYPDADELKKLILFNNRQIQCIVGKVDGICTVDFGKTQQPELWDYADGTDTLAFLRDL